LTLPMSGLRGVQTDKFPAGKNRRCQQNGKCKFVTMTTG
jgi:hypothetical protein